MKIIGLTGGIGSGKSTVSAILKDLGAAVIDADKVGHEIIEPQTPGWQAIIDAFGLEILTSQNAVDRKKLGAIVFKDPEARKKLNHILHPRIFAEIKHRLKEYEKEGYKVAAIEAALLIEAGWSPLMNAIWITVSPRNITLKRLKERGVPESEALARIAAQVPGEKKLDRATAVIENTGSLKDLRSKVEKLWYEIDNEYRGNKK